MQTERQKANLKRGGIRGTAATAARARKAKAEHAAEDERFAATSRTDPEAAVLELHADLTVGVRRLLRGWLSKGGNPPRVLIEALREFRQASRDAIEYLHARGAATEAKEFFAEMEKRLQAGAPNLGERLHPYLEEPDKEV